jgi:para-nitrobenzyl esterase
LASLALASGVASASPGPAGAVDSPAESDPIQLQSGQISGERLASGVRVYLGIPFAMPPVGQLRWREPQPVAPWHGVLHADHFGPECIQPSHIDEINQYFGERSSSEDCLYLDVWVPPNATAQSRLPVLVWIHGGGFKVGSASAATYSGEYLARKGVIYVSIAYRLGALGLLAHPWLTAESPHHGSGNFAFLDQIAALRWVQNNIRPLGGDPHRVTVMGQSAGAMSVSILQSSPLAAGLFQHAVGMSGGSIDLVTVGKVRSLREAEREGIRLQQALGVTDLAALRNLAAERVLRAQLTVRADFGAVVDSYLLPGAPAELFSSRRQNDVPLLLGFTRDESFNEISHVGGLREYRDYAHKLYGDRADELLSLYPAGDDAQARRAATDVGRDSTLGVEMRTWAQAQLTHGKEPVYVYMFSHVHPYVPGIRFLDGDPRALGAYHTGDIPYWLGTLGSLNVVRQTRAWTALDQQLSQEMMNVIVTFARTGRPGRIGNLEWPRYSARERILELGDALRVIEWPDSGKLSFFMTMTPPPSRVDAAGGS